MPNDAPKRPRGRPQKDWLEKRSECVPVYLSPVEMLKLDDMRGGSSRSDWLAWAAGLREDEA